MAGETPFTYDVFLSHNRAEKSWVREFFRFLTRAGLKVFFDEESIPLGTNFVTAISQALKHSRRIILFISRRSLQSDWVALEQTAVTLRDPGASKGILIPVILDDVDEESIPAHVLVREAVKLTDRRTRDAQLQKLLHEIGVDVSGPNDLPSWPSETYTVANIEDLTEWGWEGTQLVRELVAIDYEIYGGELQVSSAEEQHWAPIFIDNRETWRLIVDAPERIIGYWHFVPLRAADYELVATGKLTYDQFTASRVALLAAAGEYDMYVAGLAVRSRHRRPAVFKLLFNSLLEVIESLARDGIFIRRICANAFTDSGVSLCRGFDMQERGPHPRRGTIFSADFLALCNNSIAGLRPEIRAIYNSR